MRGIRFLILFILLTILLLLAEIQNPDKPLEGEWNFAPDKVWETYKAGEDDFGEPDRIRVSDEAKRKRPSLN